jgi:hypothetical protein
VRTRPFARRFIVKTECFARRARDKHRKS